jgi:hypothetical protein
MMYASMLVTFAEVVCSTIHHARQKSEVCVGKRYDARVDAGDHTKKKPS